MKSFKFLILSLLVFNKIVSQNIVIDNSNPTKESIIKKWNYFTINDTIQVKIITHVPAQAVCGTSAAASISIVENINGRRFRILNLCNVSKKYFDNQIIKIIPAKKPEFAVSLPFNYEFIDGYKFKYVPSESDINILDTTWIRIIREED